MTPFPVTAAAAPALPWYRTITREQWQALAAAKVGWMLDAMDFMLYVVALNQLRSYFGFSDAMAGLLATIALVMSGVGGLTFGYVADRFGRTRALMGTIALFSIASLGAASSQSVWQLMLWRALLAPKNLPADRLAMLEAVFRDAASQPKFKEFLASQGETLWLGSSDELRTLIRDEYKALGEVSQTLGLKKS